MYRALNRSTCGQDIHTHAIGADPNLVRSQTSPDKLLDCCCGEDLLAAPQGAVQAQSYHGILANDAYLAKIETDDSTFATREFWCAYDTSAVKIEVEAVSIIAGSESRTIEWEPIHDTISIESNDIVRLKMMTDTIDIASQDTLHIFLGGIASDEQIFERISGVTVGVYDATDSSLIDS